MTDSKDFRPLMIRARTLGQALLNIYQTEAEDAPAELLELLDTAQQSLERAGYGLDGLSGAAIADNPAAGDALKVKPS